jgi:hypothetical protein
MSLLVIPKMKRIAQEKLDVVEGEDAEEDPSRRGGADPLIFTPDLHLSSTALTPTPHPHLSQFSSASAGSFASSLFIMSVLMWYIGCMFLMQSSTIRRSTLRPL